MVCFFGFGVFVYILVYPYVNLISLLVGWLLRVKQYCYSLMMRFSLQVV